jgi:hypothetical protein
MQHIPRNSAMSAILPKLAPIVARLSTDFDNEKLACIGAMQRLLASQNLGFIDFADWMTALPASTDGPRRSAKYGPRRDSVPNELFSGLDEVLGSDAATERELEIAASLLSQARRLGGLTEKQIELGRDIVERVRARGGEQ